MSLDSQSSATRRVPYGPCALALGPAVASPPTLDADLTGWQDALCLDRFYSTGSVESAVTPTSAGIAWDEDALYVGFRCAEPHPGYRPLDHMALPPSHLCFRFHGPAYPAGAVCRLGGGACAPALGW